MDKHELLLLVRIFSVLQIVLTSVTIIVGVVGVVGEGGTGPYSNNRGTIGGEKNRK